MPAKLRQLGWMCVAPTPATHACADEGRSDRRVVDPRNTMRSVGGVDGLGPLGESSHAVAARIANAASVITGDCRCSRGIPFSAQTPQDSVTRFLSASRARDTRTAALIDDKPFCSANALTGVANSHRWTSAPEKMRSVFTEPAEGVPHGVASCFLV